MNPFASDAALAAHRRAAPGRVYIHLHDGIEDDSEPEPPRCLSLPPNDGRRPGPIDWQAEADALCMTVGVLRDRHPEDLESQRTRLAQWRTLAVTARMSYESYRRGRNKRIAYLRKRLREGTA